MRANQYDLAVSGQALAEAERALYAKCGTGPCGGEGTALALIRRSVRPPLTTGHPRLAATEAAVHEALCDSIDTPTAMAELLDLIRHTNTYLNSRTSGHCTALLLKVAKYIQRILTVRGAKARDPSKTCR